MNMSKADDARTTKKEIIQKKGCTTGQANRVRRDLLTKS